MSVLERCAWPIERLDAALAALLERHQLFDDELRAAAPRTPAPAPHVDDRPLEPAALRKLQAELGRWLSLRAATLGAEVEPLQLPIGELERSLARLGPALLLLERPDRGPVVLALDRGARLLGPDLRVVRASMRELAEALAEHRVAPIRAEAEKLLERAAVPSRRRSKALAALVGRRVANFACTGIWQLRRPPHATLPRQLLDDGIGRSLAMVVGAHVLHYVLLLGSWWLIGRGILQGRSDLGWLAAWALLLLSLIPLRAAYSWHGALAAVRLGSVLKRRLLAGALALDPDELRSRGVGRLLAMVIEAEAVESLALSSGLLAATALIDLCAAGWVLTRGVGGAVMLIGLLLWFVALLVLGWRYAVARRAWTRERLNMTHALVERMVGHTTRLAQEPPQRWHEHEDAATASYFARSVALDRSATLVDVFARRGWMVVGVLGLWPALVGGGSTTAALAITFGGMLLARDGFTQLAAGITDIVDLSIAWREVGPLVEAGGRVAAQPRFMRPEPDPAAPHDDRAPLIEARELSFRYVGRERLALRGVDLRVHAGERLLLEGPSGGGKSTLAALLAGLRRPGTGLLLLDGLDRPTHGEQGWRERVAAAPQFHLNHVLTNTFAFNLLMGRRWPPTHEDLQLAHALCLELGLGPLLERMPAGMMQNVGETGWQLSHGERSRLFLARALLQGAELVILDESFAALDPDNQALALQCAFDRAPTLLVIAHP
jgi:ATP-binding cassette subfamily B protein